MCWTVVTVLPACWTDANDLRNVSFENVAVVPCHSHLTCSLEIVLLGDCLWFVAVLVSCLHVALCIPHSRCYQQHRSLSGLPARLVTDPCSGRGTPWLFCLGVSPCSRQAACGALLLLTQRYNLHALDVFNTPLRPPTTPPTNGCCQPGQVWSPGVQMHTGNTDVVVLNQTKGTH